MIIIMPSAEGTQAAGVEVASEGEPGLSDADKTALIAFLKTF